MLDCPHTSLLTLPDCLVASIATLDEICLADFNISLVNGPIVQLVGNGPSSEYCAYIFPNSLKVSPQHITILVYENTYHCSKDHSITIFVDIRLVEPY